MQLKEKDQYISEKKLEIAANKDQLTDKNQEILKLIEDVKAKENQNTEKDRIIKNLENELKAIAQKIHKSVQNNPTVQRGSNIEESTQKKPHTDGQLINNSPRNKNTGKFTEPGMEDTLQRLVNSSIDSPTTANSTLERLVNSSIFIPNTANENALESNDTLQRLVNSSINSPLIIPAATNSSIYESQISDETLQKLVNDTESFQIPYSPPKQIPTTKWAEEVEKDKSFIEVLSPKTSRKSGESEKQLEKPSIAKHSYHHSTYPDIHVIERYYPTISDNEEDENSNYKRGYIPIPSDGKNTESQNRLKRNNKYSLDRNERYHKSQYDERKNLNRRYDTQNPNPHRNHSYDRRKTSNYYRNPSYDRNRKPTGNYRNQNSDLSRRSTNTSDRKYENKPRGEKYGTNKYTRRSPSATRDDKQYSKSTRNSSKNYKNIVRNYRERTSYYNQHQDKMKTDHNSTKYNSRSLYDGEKQRSRRNPLYLEHYDPKYTSYVQSKSHRERSPGRKHDKYINSRRHDENGHNKKDRNEDKMSSLKQSESEYLNHHKKYSEKDEMRSKRNEKQHTELVELTTLRNDEPDETTQILQKMKEILQPLLSKSAMEKTNERQICKFHQQRRCKFGTDCRNLHVSNEKTTIQPKVARQSDPSKRL